MRPREINVESALFESPQKGEIEPPEQRRIILHVDMDQFYAAVEERKNPELRGKPVIVGADPKKGKGRGVVSTCNYTARKFGVRSGMPISRAWKLCPDAIYLRPNFRLYISTSSRIMRILREYADKFEPWGLDEAFLDISLKAKDFEKARDLAKEIKRNINEKEQLTCSIGVAPNKLVAKIASDFKKPDGLTVVEEKDVKSFLAPLSVRKLLWIGKKTERKLNEMNVKTIGDLATIDLSILTRKFGVVGAQFYNAARGIDNSEVAERTSVKSVSRETTFEKDTSDIDSILEVIDNLSREIHEELIERKKTFQTVTVKIRYKNFKTYTHGKTLPFSSKSLETMQKAAKELIRPYLKKNIEIRLVGVKASKLALSQKQQTLA